MKLKNQGKRLGRLLFLSFFLAPGVQAADKAADVSWYASINRALLHADDGHQKDTYFVDNDNFSSRGGITAEKKVDDCLSVGGALELEFKSASSAGVSQLDRNHSASSASDGIKIRKVDTWLKGDFGKLSIGHGFMASYIAIGSDLSGTAATVSYAGPWLTGGGMLFHDKANAGAIPAGTTNPKVINVFSVYGDGLARKDRMRYDSPTFGGFSLSGSVNSGEKDNGGTGTAGRRYGSDVALRYANQFKDIKLKGAVAYNKISKGTDERNAKVVDASLAALHINTGLNLAVNFASKKLANPNAVGANLTKKGKFHRVQLGLISDLNRYGSTNFVVDYVKTKHAIANDDKGTGFGAGVVQKLKKVDSELYFSVRRLKYKGQNDTTQYDKMFMAMTGIRISLGGKLS